jgi:hypothetical protein
LDNNIYGPNLSRVAAKPRKPKPNSVNIAGSGTLGVALLIPVLKSVMFALSILEHVLPNGQFSTLPFSEISSKLIRNSPLPKLLIMGSKLIDNQLHYQQSL